MASKINTSKGRTCFRLLPLASATLCFFTPFSAQGAESLLDWSTRPSTNLETAATDVANVDGITVTTSGTEVGGRTSDTLQLAPTTTLNGYTGIISSAVNATIDDESVYQEIRFDFSEPVYNLRFRAIDVDGFNDGSTLFSDLLIYNSSAGVPSAGTTAGANITYTLATGRALENATTNCTGNQAQCQVNVVYDGPITWATVRHVAAAVTGSNNPTNQAIQIFDLTFNTAPDATDNSNSTFSTINATGNVITDNDGGGTDTDRQDGANVLVNQLSHTDGTVSVGAAGATLTLANGATLTIAQDGTYTFDPNGAYQGLPAGTVSTEVFTYRIEDQEGLFNTNGDTPNPDSVATLTINITTHFPPPVLTLIKTVINSTAADTDWTLTFNGPATGTGIEGSVAVTSVSVPAGTYSLSETNVSAPSNYSLANLVCTGSADTTTTVLNPNITLSTGENVTCEFFNRRFRTITLLKDVVGGPAADTDWTLRAISTAVSRVGVEGSAQVTAVGAGNQILTLSEINGPTGYVLTNLGCVGTVDTSTSVASPTLSVANGESAFCTFTNTFDGSFTIAKAVDINNTSSTGTLTYTITVNNTGTADLTGTNLIDSLEQNGTPLTLTSGPGAPSGDTDGDSVLDVGETWVYTATYDVTQANLDDGNDIENTATFSSTYVSAQSDIVRTTITTNPSLAVTKTATYGSGPTIADGTTDNLPVGELITYTYRISNDGNQTLTNISAADIHNGSGPAPTPDLDTAILTDNAPLADSSNPTTGDNDWDSLAPGDVLTVTDSYTVTQSDVDTLQ